MRKIKVLIALIIFSFIVVPKINAYEIGREVYIRHIDKDGGAIIGGIENAEQVLKDSEGNLSLVSNSSSIDVPAENYSEYYSFDLDKTMTISKSMVVLRGGFNYTYLGYVKRTDVSYDVAMGYAENARKQIIAGNDVYDVKYSSTDNSTTLYTFPQKNENDVTIIDFYYSKTSTENVAIKLFTRSSATPSDTRLNTTDVTYVPASAFLHPYFEAPAYYATDLSYKKVIDNNNIKYNLERYVVNIAANGELVNSGSVIKDGKEIKGDVIGNGSQYIIGGVNEVTTAVQKNIPSILSSLDLSATNEVENYNTKQNQKLILGDNLVASDFEERNYAVTFTGYNGLRSAKGNLVYQQYDVLAGMYSGERIVKNSTNEHFINLYTPIKMDIPEVVITSEQDINHSNTSATTVIMGDDASFEVRLRCSDSNFFQGVGDVDKARFVKYYYLLFDFDVIHNGRLYTKGSAIRMTNTAEFLGGITYFRGQVAPNETLSRDSSNHKIIVIAEASNAPEGPLVEGSRTITQLLQNIADQEEAIQILHTKTTAERQYLNDSGDNEANFSNDLEHAESHTPAQYTGGVAMYSDGYYYAMRTVVVRTVSRIYDLRITDCTDLAYKSVFRNSNNELIGNNYFSGTRRMFVYANGNKEFTTIMSRSGDDLYIYGTSSTKTLPLGPYKHNTATYTKAPKLGYRIAFDLKTSGFYMADGNDVTSRRIIIKPSYYFISKDGNTIIKDIDLYYRDQTDRYRNFEGSNYTIYFTPNDGYRLKSNSTTSNVDSMTTKSTALNLGSSSGEFYLNDYMMSSEDSNYIQSWYGEFKFPNTTIAVRKGDNVNNILTDGYIGVKFDITCSDTVLDETISYNSPNKNAGSQVNTTQWDYEGYLGFANPGQPITETTSLRLQLEKGIWVIKDQETYDFVKGTVVLFDADDRASDDIQ